MYALFVPTLESPRIKRPNVRLMIGNVVSVLITIVTRLFNYILINVKELVRESILDLINQILNIQAKRMG